MTNQKPTLYILALALCVLLNVASCQSNQTTLPQSVIEVMASREERHHHFLWHNIRENWNRLSLSSQQQIRDLGWAPPNPARRFDSKGNSIAITDNYSGEDFLYMHRQMIAKVNKILADNNEPYGKVKGWTTLPAPGDKDWPVPSNYTIPNNTGRTAAVNDCKTASFYNKTIKPMETALASPTQLRKLTLSEFAAVIEVTLHAWYHLRYSGVSPSGYRPTSTGGLPSIDTKWDNPSYDWLVDTYASQVNPAFWKIHGWIDDRIEDWRKANGLSSIRWNGTWVGGPMSRIAYLWDKKETATSLRGTNVQGTEPTESQVDVMQEVAQLLFDEGVESDFTTPVLLENPIKTASGSKKRLCKANFKKRTQRRL